MGSRKVYVSQAKKMQARETALQKAVSGIRSGLYKNAKDAAYALGIPHTTVWRRLNEKAKPRCKAHMNQQLLNDDQELVLINYTIWLGFAGIPLSKRTIAPKVEALCGRKPSRRWVHRFLARNPGCTLGRPTGLDTKRARNFNFTSVNAYFQRLQRILEIHDIPWCNVWNMDEIGIQHGGGRKNTGELFLFSLADRVRYKLKSEELELTTVLEAICGDGTATVPPCLVFQGVQFCEEWFEVNDDILYV